MSAMNQEDQRRARQSKREGQFRKKRRRQNSFAWWTLPIIALAAVALIGMGVYVREQIGNYDDFNAMRRRVQRDTFYDGVSIDGIPLGGLTMDQARAKLSEQAGAQGSKIEIILRAGEYHWRITEADIPLAWNTDSLLQKAYALGRHGSLETRYAEVTRLSLYGQQYTSAFEYDRAALRALTDTVAARLTIEGNDAGVVAFDVAARSFAFSDEKIGQYVDADTLYQTVAGLIDGGQYQATLSVDVQTILPRVTREQLEQRYGRITSFTTNTTSNANRNTNIRIAADALNGTMVAPGETISFNEVTGQRTRDKGYCEAGAIAGGRTIEEVGGGVCQVSTTMFNALLRADFEIVKRYPHAWPSDYVPRGEDATVDWPNTDLVMRNTSDAPMFITAWYTDRKITVEVYGLSPGDGVTIDLESVTTYTDRPEKDEVVYTYNGDLKLGTTKLVRNAHTGYRVVTYKVHYRNGEEIAREEFYVSNYRKILEEYEYNDGNPPDTN